MTTEFQIDNQPIISIENSRLEGLNKKTLISELVSKHGNSNANPREIGDDLGIIIDHDGQTIITSKGAVFQEGKESHYTTWKNPLCLTKGMTARIALKGIGKHKNEDYAFLTIKNI